MEETREQQRLHGFLQSAIYISLLLEACIFIYLKAPFWGLFSLPLRRLALLPIYRKLLYSKLATLFLICLVSVGTLAKKEKDLSPKRQIVLPLAIGLCLFFGSLACRGRASPLVLPYTTWLDLLYMICSLAGALMVSLSMDNVSKLIRSGLGKDKWNTEAESFMQPVKKVETPYTVNIPMLFYYNKRVRQGWINIPVFRGAMVIGVPGSGKSYSVVNPYIRQLIAKGFAVCLYDFKFV